MPLRERDFVCEECGCCPKFRIIVEPEFDDSTLETQNPEAIDWLADVRICPVCGSDLIPE